MGAVVFFGASLQGVGEVRDRSGRAGYGVCLEEDGGKEGLVKVIAGFSIAEVNRFHLIR